jgi:YfiH family protein
MTLPALPPAFEWVHASWGPGLRCLPLAAIAPHVFSSRHLAVRTPEGERELAAAVQADRLAMVTQVHGRAVVVVRAGEPPSPPGTRPEADVLVSIAPDIAVAVRAADCAPILIADSESGAVAAVHAGWRGTAAGAVVAAVEALGREFAARPEHLVAAVGPAIGPCCYQVGPELVDAFAAAGHERHLIARWFSTPPPPRGSREQPVLRLDIAGANRDQLVLAGLPEEQVHVAGLCTAMHLDVLTSFRAERERSARLAAAIRARGPQARSEQAR